MPRDRRAAGLDRRRGYVARRAQAGEVEPVAAGRLGRGLPGEPRPLRRGEGLGGDRRRPRGRSTLNFQLSTAARRGAAVCGRRGVRGAVSAASAGGGGAAGGGRRGRRVPRPAGRLARGRAAVGRAPPTAHRPGAGAAASAGLGLAGEPRNGDRLDRPAPARPPEPDRAAAGVPPRQAVPGRAAAAWRRPQGPRGGRAGRPDGGAAGRGVRRVGGDDPTRRAVQRGGRRAGRKGGHLAAGAGQAKEDPCGGAGGGLSAVSDQRSAGGGKRAARGRGFASARSLNSQLSTLNSFHACIHARLATPGLSV